MKRLALVGFPDGLARQDITPTWLAHGFSEYMQLKRRLEIRL